MRAATIVATAAVAWVGLEASAQACRPDPCWESFRVTGLGAVQDVVASDGVLVFARDSNGAVLTTEELLPYLSVTVTDAMGVPVQGTLGPIDEAGFDDVVWRPSAALPEGESLQVTWSLDNDAIATDYDPDWLGDVDWCATNIDDASTVVVTGPRPQFAMPAPTVTEMLELKGYVELDSLVCCDGAMPSILYGDCGPGGGDASWNEGFCTPTRGEGRVTGTLSWAGVDADASVLADAVVEMLVDGQPVAYGRPGTLALTRTESASFCAQLQAISLSTGETFVGEAQCFGVGEEDQLGSDLPIDPDPLLADNCAGEAYVCEVDGDAWNPQACDPWEPGGADGGTSGTTGADGATDEGGGDGGGSSDGALNDGGGDATSGGGSSGSSAGIDDSGVAGRGCSCASGAGRSGGLGWLVVVIGAGLVRRRRFATRR